MVDVPRRTLPNDPTNPAHQAERVRNVVEGMNPRSGRGGSRWPAPVARREVMQAGARGIGSRNTQEIRFKIDQFTIEDDDTVTFALTYRPIADSWNVSCGYPLDDAADYAIAGQTLTALAPAVTFIGASPTFPKRLQVEYAYLAGAPTSPMQGTYPELVLAESSLLGYWRLGEASGTTMTDSSGNGRDGTYFNGPTLGTAGLLTGDPDTAAYFADATQEYGAVASASWMDVSALTAEAIIEPHNVTSARAILDRTSYPTGVVSWSFSITNIRSLTFTIYISGTSHTLTASGVLDSVVSGYRVYHAAATYDGAHMRIYLDGVEVASQAQTGALDTGTAQLNVGRTKYDVNPHGNFWFEGTIDEAAVYSTALDAATIAAHAAAR